MTKKEKTDKTGGKSPFFLKLKEKDVP